MKSNKEKIRQAVTEMLESSYDHMIKNIDFANILFRALTHGSSAPPVRYNFVPVPYNIRLELALAARLAVLR